jgi:hypothetical protein
LSPRNGGVRPSDFSERSWRVLAALDEVAARHASTPGPVALAWQMRRLGIIAPIVGTTSPAQRGELATAASLALHAEDLAALAAASASKGAASRGRPQSDCPRTTVNLWPRSAIKRHSPPSRKAALQGGKQPKVRVCAARFEIRAPATRATPT